jgi:hypothetical protein
MRKNVLVLFNGQVGDVSKVVFIAIASKLFLGLLSLRTKNLA